ncbi:hypothetical protein [Aestuariivivens sediminis]|uniref:hypothetical protein n=1 Tax=Aestuariivivens sediminis TaxID=2913557 RepID=UPI001F59DD6C|nr:hypothetical protein [Aestuariivivens sediminis]
MDLFKVIMVFLTAMAFRGYAQSAGGYKITPWRLLEFSGNVGVQGMLSSVKYQNDTTLLNQLDRSHFTGIAKFNSKSYVMHPNLLVLDINASYNPVFSNFAALGLPDFATEIIQKQLFLSSEILKEQPLSFRTRINLSESTVNVDNIESYDRINKNYGASALYRNRVLGAVMLNYDARKSFLKNSSIGRRLDQSGDILQLNVSKGINSRFYTNLHAVHRTDNTDAAALNKVSSTTDRVSLNTNYKFSKGYKNRFNSNIDYFKRSRYASSERLSFLNRLDLKLSDRMRWSNTANYGINGFKNGNIKTLTFNSFFTHTLYQSLTSTANVGYTNTKSNFIKQTNYNFAIGNRYTKNIPFNGKLRIHHTYSKRINNTNGLSTIFEENNKEYRLSDNDVVLLGHSNIARNTIVVRNDTGTLIYEENIDYVLYEIGNFIEIQRLPGGLIENNTTVLISYTANQNGDYTINSNTNSFTAGVTLFKDIIHFNYFFNNQTFKNTSLIIYESENYYKSMGYEGSITYDFFQGSLRYQKYISDLVPYSLLSYNINLRGNLRQNIIYNLNYNGNGYSLIQEAGRNEHRERLTGMLAYAFNTKHKINFTIAYNKRKVNETKRKWLSGQVSYRARIGQLSFMTNVNFFNSHTAFYKANFIGGQISIFRNF